MRYFVFLFFMKMVERLVVIVGFWYVHATEGLSSHPRSDELDVKFITLLAGDFPLWSNLSLTTTYTQQPSLNIITTGCTTAIMLTNAQQQRCLHGHFTGVVKWASSFVSELGPRHPQKAQQWCLTSQTYPPPYSRWVGTYVNTRDYNRYTLKRCCMHISVSE